MSTIAEQAQTYAPMDLQRRNNQEPPGPHNKTPQERYIPTIQIQSSKPAAQEPNGEARSMGINGLIKSYSGLNKFSGGWDEDLERSICIYKSMCSMCELIPQEKLNGLTVMLKDDSLDYYTDHSSGSK